MEESRVTIVYDNNASANTLESGWGFSCFIEHNKEKILFDTGDDAAKLLSNLKALGIDRDSFNTVVLSHGHWDHTGGIDAVAGDKGEKIVYIGKGFPEGFKRSLRERDIRFSEIGNITEIKKDIFIGPQMGSFGPREIPLTVRTKKGLVIITGCAHPGIVRMVKRIKKIFNEDIFLVLGGFHLEYSLNARSVVKDLKKLEVRKAGPCHCTGERAIDLFRQEFGENFTKIMAGSKIMLA